MKIILSRKGFDAEAGGFASPILPDGRMISLPIPEESSEVKYSELSVDGQTNYYSLMESLYKGKIKRGNQWTALSKDTGCHLDPDINRHITKRAANWRGVFGQVGQSAVHLQNQGVQQGDIFLFIGWFKQTIWCNDRLIYKVDEKDGRHVLFGYLQVGQIIKPTKEAPKDDWLKMHPHLHDSYLSEPSNTLFIAADHLSFMPDIPGCGSFQYSDKLVLSKAGETKSKWALPTIFRDTDISYHKKDSWQNGYFQSVRRGQEFVLTASDEIERWTQDLIAMHNIQKTHSKVTHI